MGSAALPGHGRALCLGCLGLSEQPLTHPQLALENRSTPTHRHELRHDARRAAKAAPSAHQSTCRTGKVSIGESLCSIVAAIRARRLGFFATREKTTCCRRIGGPTAPSSRPRKKYGRASTSRARHHRCSAASVPRAMAEARLRASGCWAVRSTPEHPGMAGRCRAKCLNFRSGGATPRWRACSRGRLTRRSHAFRQRKVSLWTCDERSRHG